MASNSAVVGILRALLIADTAQFETGMKRSGDAAKEWSKQLAKTGREAQNIGSALTKTITLPILALAGSSVKAAMDFESSFAGVRKTVEATEPQFAALAQGFRNLAKEIPVNVNELNKLGESAGALGIKREDIMQFTKVMAQLGVTTNLTSDQAANAIARIQNIFGAAGKDTDRLASTLVALGNAGASTEQEIVEMGLRIAGAGNTIGLTQAQVLSFASTLASVGINAEAGGSAISRVFLKMNDAVMDGGEKLTEFARVAGISAADFKAAFENDAAQATVLFINGLSRLKSEGANTNQVMEGLIGKNIILKDTLNRLAGSGKLLADQLALGNTAWEQNNALTNEARERFKTTASQLQILWNQVKDVGITLGNALLPAIQSAVRLMGNLIPVIDTLAKGFAALPGPIQMIALGIVALAAAAGPAIYAFGSLALASGSVTAAFAANGLASRVLTANLALTTAGVRGAALAAMATTTAYGAMGAATIAVTGVMRGLWVLMAAHPITAVAAAVGALTLALTKWATAAANSKAKEVLDDVKRLTIARAEEAGVMLKATDITNRYLEAVEQLNYRENVRLGLVGRNIDLEKQQIDLKVKAGKISQEQANVLLATMQIEEQSTSVREKRISFANAAALAEKKFNEEIKASGYSLAEIQAQLKNNEQGFAAWAKQVGLSDDTIARLKGTVKQLAAETKATDKAAKEFVETLKDQMAALTALGLITEAAVNEQLGELMETFSFGVNHGLHFKTVLGALLPKLEELSVKAKLSGTSTRELAEALAVARQQAHLLSLIKPFDPSMFGSGSAEIGFPSLKSKITKFDPSMLMKGLTSLTGPSMGETFAKSFGADFAKHLGPTLIGALQGGGNPTLAIGAMGGQALGTSFVNNFGGKLTSMFGKTLGGVFSSLIPGVGALIGPLAGKLVGKLIEVFKGGEGAKVNDIRDGFLKAQGGAESLYKQLEKIGRLDLWQPLMAGPAKLGAIEAAINGVSKALGEAEAKTAATAAAADELGLTWKDMGRDVQQAKIVEIASSLLTKTKDLTAAGYDHDTVVRKQASAYSDLYNTAKRLGIELPADIMPILEKLREHGLLLDENGNKVLSFSAKHQEAMSKITDQLKVLDEEIKTLEDSIANEAPEEVMGVVEAQTRARIEALKKEREEAQKEFDKLAEDSKKSADEWSRTHKDAAKAFMEYAKTLFEKGLTFPIKFDIQGVPGSTSQSQQSQDDGPTGTPGQAPGFAHGTHGQYVDFGAGTLAELHGKEKITPYGEETNGGGTSDLSGNVYLDGRLVGRSMFAPIVREAARQQVTQR